MNKRKKEGETQAQTLRKRGRDKLEGGGGLINYNPVSGNMQLEKEDEKKVRILLSKERG